MAGRGRVRVVVREDSHADGDVHGGHSRFGPVTGASRFLIGLVTCAIMPRRAVFRSARQAWQRFIPGGPP
jgi:hypothetical protein